MKLFFRQGGHPDSRRWLTDKFSFRPDRRYINVNLGQIAIQTGIAHGIVNAAVETYAEKSHAERAAKGKVKRGQGPVPGHRLNYSVAVPRGAAKPIANKYMQRYIRGDVQRRRQDEVALERMLLPAVDTSSLDQFDRELLTKLQAMGRPDLVARRLAVIRQGAESYDRMRAVEHEWDEGDASFGKLQRRLRWGWLFPSLRQDNFPLIISNSSALDPSPGGYERHEVSIRANGNTLLEAANELAKGYDDYISPTFVEYDPAFGNRDPLGNGNEQVARRLGATSLAVFGEAHGRAMRQPNAVAAARTIIGLLQSQ